MAQIITYFMLCFILRLLWHKQEQLFKMVDRSQSMRAIFPTCQVRVVRFYVSCPPRLPPLRLLLRRTSTASARLQRSPPDPNSKPRIRVLPTGPQLQARDRKGPRRTRTATARWIRAFPAGAQLQVLDRSVPRRTSTTKNLRRYTR